MISIPVIAHATEPIPCSDRYRHSSHLIISVQHVDNNPTASTNLRERQLYAEVYADLQKFLEEALFLFPTNPTESLSRLKQLSEYLKGLF